ncbi:MAG: MGMT family protein [Nitrososphaerota archaeon]|nr:MGMT family protein [Nitrososphaerota archaeon]
MRKSHFRATDVYKLVSKIPKGRVSTYGVVAKALKAKGASRAVGQILKANPNPIVVPCHRVVKSDGSIGGYGGAAGSSKKIKLLRSEGVAIRDGRVVDLERIVLKKF